MRTTAAHARDSLVMAPRAVSFASLVFALGACAAPLQNGGVEVISGADGRLGMLCRWRRGDEARKDVCVSSDAPVKPARVRVIAKEGDALLKGAQASGTVGDSVLENQEVVVVIRRVDASLEDSGALIDAADARRRSDAIGHVGAWISGAMSPRYTSQASGVGADGVAWVAVKGHGAVNDALTITTRYSLGPADRAVVISTTVENTTAAPIGLLDLGDAVAWGAAEALTPGSEPNASGEVKGPYVAGVGSDVAYLLAPVKDVEVSSRTHHGGSDVVFERDITVPPGGSVALERALAITERGDPVAVVTEFFYMQGIAPGGLLVKLVEAGGAAFTAPPGGRLFLDRTSAAADAPPRVDTWWMSAEGSADDASIIGGEAPPGRYILRFEGGGRFEAQRVPVEVKAGEVVKRVLEVTPPSIP